MGHKLARPTGSGIRRVSLPRQLEPRGRTRRAVTKTTHAFEREQALDSCAGDERWQNAAAVQTLVSIRQVVSGLDMNNNSNHNVPVGAAPPNGSPERLWTVTKDGRRRYAELLDNGARGVELSVFAGDGVFLYGRHFATRAQAMRSSDGERDERCGRGWTVPVE